MAPTIYPKLAPKLAVLRSPGFNAGRRLNRITLDPHRLLGWLGVRWLEAPRGTLRTLLHWASERTGLPAVVVAAVVLVTAVRVFKRSFRLAVELTLAVVLLMAATRFGWIAW
jgi:hypothetical protein